MRTITAVMGMLMAKYIHIVGATAGPPSVDCQLIRLLYSGLLSDQRNDKPFWKLKKVMLKTDARYVAGKKMEPSSEMVFIEVLSRLLA